MFLPIAIAFLAHLAGVLLGLGGRRRSLAALRTFALVSALAVVLGQLLPDALGGMGLGALAVFAVFAVLPSLVDKLSAQIGKKSGGALGLELGYLALAVHQVADGLALGAYGGHAHEGHSHGDVLLALSAHTVPLAALVTLAYQRRANARVAVLRVTGLLVATLAGIIATSLVPAATFERFEPWITAAVAGLLLHVVVHDWEPERAPAGTGERLVDLVAVGAGVGLVLLGGHDHHEGDGVRAPIAEALWELSLATAPALLFGLVVGALVSAWSAGRMPARWLGGGPLRQAAVGASIGAPMPICACNVLPRAEALRSRGAGPALVVAFLLATPALGVDTFALTARLIGWPFALVRLGAAVALAMIAGLLVHRATRGRVSEVAEEPSSNTPSSFGARFVECFDALLLHIAPWMVVGLVVAAYVQATLGEGALAGVGGYGLDYLIVILVAAPSYVCAASATPLAAVLLSKGMSSGAVLIGLLVASTANIAALRFLGARYGVRGASLAVGALVVGGWVIALAVDASGLTVSPAAHVPREGIRAGVTHALAVLLGVLLLRSIWRVGLRGWFSSVGESFGAGHGHHHHHLHGHEPPTHPVPDR